MGGLAGPAPAPGLPGGPRTREARRWVSYLSIAVYLESADHSDTLNSVAFQRKPTRTRGGGGRTRGGPFFLQLGTQRRSRIGTTLVFLHPSFQALEVPRSVLGIAPSGKSYPPRRGFSLPRAGSEGWDAVQTKVGFQLAG